MAEPQSIQVPSTAAGQRIDAWLAKAQPEHSRSRWKELIDNELLTVNQRKVKAKYSLQGGETIEWTVPEQPSGDTLPQELPLTILYEDDDLIVLDKAHGMVVHPAVGNTEGTLVNALLHHTQGKLASIGAPVRPGIVHRLDRDTSGCIVVAKTDAAHRGLVKQFSNRKMLKLYLAVCQGVPAKPSGTIFTHIARQPVNRQKMAVCEPPHGKPSITDYRVIRPHPLNHSSLVLCHLHTGRTHQIRVHMGHLGHPLLGDPIYARPARQPWGNRLLLHAWHLSFTHPMSGKTRSFTANPPSEYDDWTEGVNLSQLLDLARQA